MLFQFPNSNAYGGNPYINVSPQFSNSSLRAIQLNNQALQASSNGDFTTAEQLHLDAISLKETFLGANNATTGLSYNALGELYLKMKRLNEAELFLSKAIRVRNASGTPFDAAVSRENMAQLYELRGNLAKAKEIRLTGAPDKLACGYYQCPGQLFDLKQLEPCEQCKSVYYCSTGCKHRQMIGPPGTGVYAEQIPKFLPFSIKRLATLISYRTNEAYKSIEKKSSKIYL